MKKKKAGWEKEFENDFLGEYGEIIDVWDGTEIKKFIRKTIAQELRGLRMVKNTTFGFISPYREGYNEAVGVNNKAINQRLKEGKK